MGLRFALMGLVASLGLQPPAQADWECWVDSGRQMCGAAWADWADCQADPMPNGLDAFGATDDVDIARDRAFESTVNDWVETVLVDRPMLGEQVGERLAKSCKIEVIDQPEPTEYVETPGELLARRLNLQPEPAPIMPEPLADEPIEVAAAAKVEVEEEDPATRLNRFGEFAAPDCAAIALVEPSATEADNTVGPPPLAKRVEHALKLTNEAASAWMSLFKGSLVVSLRP